MAVIEISVVPLGTKSPSVSRYVARALGILEKAEGIKYELTPMGTIIEGDLDKILELAKEMHEITFDPEVQMHIHAGIYKQRHMVLASQLYGLMGIAREDMDKRIAWVQRGFRFYDAPAAFILTASNSLDESPTQFDLGCLTQTICLAALGYGLGTCITGQGVLYPEVSKKYCGIPKSERIVMAIAVGYPDPEFPANNLLSTREPIENVVTWLGFD